MVPWHGGVPQGRPDQPSSLGESLRGPSPVLLFVECSATCADGNQHLLALEQLDMNLNGSM